MTTTSARVRLRAFGAVLLVGASVFAGAITSEVSPVRAISTTLVISEFRLRGPNGANDEFIEVQNISSGDITVSAAGSAGFGIAASDGVNRCVIPNGTVIPRWGHYLCVNSVGYSLATYPAGNGTTAVGDATYPTDIPDNAGIALFDNSLGGANYSLATRIDAVGSTSEANTLYKEGTGYPAITPFSIDYSFYRNLSTSSITNPSLVTSTPGRAEDTDVNATDFVFVDTNGTNAGAGQRLGAPGPENLSSPIPTPGLVVGLLDPCVSANQPPNAVRDFTSDGPNNSQAGTLDLRRTITNNTGGDVTRLRFRIADQRTFPAPAGFADMRARTSTAVVVTVDRAPCGSGTSNVTVDGTTLEQPAVQPNGGAFNSSLGVGTVTLATPLANGASIDVRMLFGIQQVGLAGVRVIVEAFPGGGGGASPGLIELSSSGDLPSDFSAAVAVDDDYSTSEDTPLAVAASGVLANDTDADGNPLTATLVTGPTNGTLVFSGNGSFTYTPNANYSGPDSFTYTARYVVDTSNVATVNLTVNPVNDPPVAVDDSFTAQEDTALVVPAPGVLGNDTDLDGNPLTAALGTGPTNGTVTLNADGSFTYTPNAGYSGADSFTYTANDGATDSNTATVSITVTAVDDPPVAVDDDFTTPEDTELVVAAPGVLGNDTDAENDSLTAALGTGPTNGTVTLDADGSFTYTPDAGFSGADSFTYTANDGAADSNTATVTITVGQVNDPPVAVDDDFTTPEDTALVVAAPGVLDNDTDADGDPLTATLVTGPTNGTVTLDTDGSFTYTPDADFDGADSFTYTANDGTDDSNVATVNITVSPVNDPPEPAAVTVTRFTTRTGVRLVVTAPGVLGNHTDPDGDPLTAVLVTGTTNGTLTLNANGSFTYSPRLGFVGTDSFTYRASDGVASSAPVVVTITVTRGLQPIPSTGGSTTTIVYLAAATLLAGLALRGATRRRRIT